MTVREKISDVLWKAYRMDKVSELHSVEISDAIPELSVRQVQNGINAMMTAGLMISTHIADKSAHRGRRTVYSLVAILEQETAPNTPNTPANTGVEILKSNSIPKSKDVEIMAAGKPRQGTPEYDIAKLTEQVRRQALELDRAIEALRTVPNSDPAKLLAEFMSTAEANRVKDWQIQRELLVGIGKIVDEIYSHNSQVHQKTADTMDWLSSADQQQQIGFENGFEMGLRIGKKQVLDEQKEIAKSLTEMLDLARESGPSAKDLPKQRGSILLQVLKDSGVVLD